VKRVISVGGGLLFKGSGFYITDHRNQDYRKREKEDKGKAEAKPVEGVSKDSGVPVREDKAGTPGTGTAVKDSVTGGSEKGAAPPSKPADSGQGSTSSGATNSQ
jgi:hypothetical protein